MIYDVIDINHNNDITSYSGLYDQDGIRRVILKVTQGTTFVDPLFAYRVPRMLEVGLQLGGYHFMTADDPVDQAHFFLTQVVKNGLGMVKFVAMDLEENQGSQPTVEMGEAFVSELAKNLGYMPINYMNVYGPNGRGTGLPSTVLSACGLWLPKYGAQPTRTSLPAGYSNWLLWQCNDGTEGSDVQPIRNADGPIDRSWFNGTADQATVLFAQGHL